MKTTQHIKYNNNFQISEFVEKTAEGDILIFEKYNDKGQLVEYRVNDVVELLSYDENGLLAYTIRR